MPIEADLPPALNTYKFVTWSITRGIAWARSYFGRRLVGTTVGLFADMIAEGADQAFYARLPGHPEQAPDSLARVGLDRDLLRFRGETDANWLQRVKDAWRDYTEGGTLPQMIRVVNQWGMATFPFSWNPANLTLTESVVPTVFEFEISIPYGMISPAWVPEFYGVGSHAYGEVGFYYGLSSETDLAMLQYIVRKWKPSRSVGKIKIYYNATDSVTVRV